MIGIKTLLAIASCGCVATGCDSNPTPHPQADATVSYDAMAETGAPNEGEYTDIDNAPDCATAGGFWDDAKGCRGGVDATDTVDAAEVEATPDVGEVADGEVDEVGEIGEVGEGDVGPDIAE